MRRFRALGNIERGCWLIDQAAPMNVVTVAQLRGRLELTRLVPALAIVQRRHPLLGVFVQTESGSPSYFLSDAPIPLEVRSRCGPLQWQQVAADERNRPFHRNAAPLVRVTVLHAADESELVVTMHHMISDGMTSVYLLRDLLLALSGQAGELEPLPERPALEALLPESERGLTGLKRSARFLAEQAWAFFALRPRLLLEQKSVPASKRRSAVSHQRLSQVETSALLTTCRQHGVTVHGVLCAALLLAVGAEVRAESPAPSHRLGCCTPVNLRRVLSPAIGEDIGLYVGPIVTFHRLDENTELFALAGELTRQIHAARKAGVSALALATQSRLLPSRISPQGAAKHLYNRLFGTVSVTNMGVLDIPVYYRDLHLTALHIGGANNPYGSLISIGVTTLADQLFLNFNYNEEIVSAARLSRVVTATMRMLQ